MRASAKANTNDHDNVIYHHVHVQISVPPASTTEAKYEELNRHERKIDKAGEVKQRNKH